MKFHSILFNVVLVIARVHSAALKETTKEIEIIDYSFEIVKENITSTTPSPKKIKSHYGHHRHHYYHHHHHHIHHHYFHQEDGYKLRGGHYAGKYKPEGVHKTKGGSRPKIGHRLNKDHYEYKPEGGRVPNNFSMIIIEESIAGKLKNVGSKPGSRNKPEEGHKPKEGHAEGGTPDVPCLDKFMQDEIKELGFVVAETGTLTDIETDEEGTEMPMLTEMSTTGGAPIVPCMTLQQRGFKEVTINTKVVTDAPAIKV